MKINTKVVFEWNPKFKQYEEVYCDSYEHDGEVAECQWPSWFGGDQNRHRGWGTPQQGRFGTLLGERTPNAMMSNQQTMTNQDYMSQLRSFGSEGSIFNTFQDIEPYQDAFGDIGNIRGTRDPQSAYDIKGFGTTKGFFDKVGPSMFSSTLGVDNITGDASLSASTATKAPSDVASKASDVASKASSFMGTMAMGAGALFGGIAGYGQAKSQKKGLGVAIGELDPLKGKFMEAHERQLGIAEDYRPGGKYSRYMAGQIMSQATESAAQETQSMIASGITSPSMMRAMGRQSRRGAQASLPGMEMQVSQMALPYEQMGAQSLTQYGGVVEQLASLKGARSAINPWASAIQGGMQGIMGAASMMSSFAPLASDRRMKKDIKYLHTSNEGHKVYSFKYKDGDTKYSGVMAQDVLKINPNAVTLKNGMFAVYYDMIDVNMQQLDII